MVLAFLSVMGAFSLFRIELLSLAFFEELVVVNICEWPEFRIQHKVEKDDKNN